MPTQSLDDGSVCSHIVSTTMPTTESATEPTTETTIEQTTEPTPTKRKLMIVGGNVGFDSDVNTIDIIDLDDENSNCQAISDYPLNASDIHASVLVNMGKPTPIFCGGHGYNYTDCYTYSTVGFVESTPLIHKANCAASTMQRCSSNDEEQCLWITGSCNTGYFNTTQLVKSDSVIEGPQMPTGLDHHCVVALNDDMILVIGGYSGQRERRTFLYNLLTEKWSNGPELAQERVDHACGVYDNGENLLIYVIGGFDGSEALDSVEVTTLENDGTFKEWYPGKHSRYVIFELKMILH